MPDPLPVSHPLRTAGLAARKPTRFDLTPDAAQRQGLAEVLGLTAIQSLRFKGEIRPVGRTDFALEAQLVAVVVQPCVISLAPVTTRIDAPVLRRYLAEFVTPSEEETEAEMPADDTEEPLPSIIDVGEVMTEALALALPDYPRAPDAVLHEVVYTAPGLTPLRDSDLRPFAGLAALAKRLSPDEPGSDGNGDI